MTPRAIRSTLVQGNLLAPGLQGLRSIETHPNEDPLALHVEIRDG